MRINRPLTSTLSLLACLAVPSVAAFAQITNATITGAVTDSGGAAIPNARVEVRNTGTDAVQVVQANASGVYTVGQLIPGAYRITTAQTGFRTSVQNNIQLTVGQSATLDIKLEVGDVKQTVEVSASTELINTTTAEISQVVDERAIKGLPLNGRDPSSLVLLTTGVTNVLNAGGGVLQGETTFPNETGASAGGGRQGSTYYLLDGAPNMDTYLLLAAPFPNADATQEFRVISNNFDSRYGYSPSAIVTIQTKTGTNSFHGGAFEFIRNNALNATNYFSHNVDPLKRNQFGGYVGGPIIKDKIFFFANYQATRSSQAAGTNTTFTPTAAMLNGDFSAVPYTLNASAGFATVGGKTNQINPALFDKASVTIAKTALPLGLDPATGLVNFVGPANKQKFDEGTARLDFDISQRQKLFVRSFTNYYLQQGGAINGNIVGNAIVTGKPGKFLNEAIGHTFIASPTLVNTLTLFYTGEHVLNSGTGLDTSGNAVCLSKYVNITELPGQCYLEGFSVNNGFSTNYNEPTGENRWNYGFNENLSKTIGNHFISIGGNIWREFAQENSQYPATPIVNFSNQFTGFGLADYLLGDVNNLQQGAGEIASVKGYQYGLYGQDQWKVRPDLTLTLGLRWDPNTPPQSAGGRGAQYRPGQQSTRFPNAPTGLIFPGDAGLNAALQPTTYNYVQPRVGFSYQPHALPHVVVRGGFGIFTGPLPYSAYNHVADIAPFSPTFNVNFNPTNMIKFSNLASGFPGGKSPFPPFASLSDQPPASSTFVTPVNLGATFSPDFKLVTNQTWNLSVDQQFTKDIALHIAYVASQSYHLAQIVDLNPGRFNFAAIDPNTNRQCVTTTAQTTCPTVRSIPNFAQIQQDTSLGTSPYHSLQFGVEKRFSHGLQFQSNFTWSKTIDLSSTGNISFSGGLANPYDIRFNRGTSDLNVPHIWVSNAVYSFPTLAKSNFLTRTALGGWQVSVIYTLQNGRPFGIGGGANGNNNSGALQGGDRANFTPGVIARVHQGSKQQWINNYITPGSFTPNPVGTFGNTGRNIFTAPATNTADMSFAKNFAVKERYRAQFRWELFNAFNHTSFGTPNTDPTGSNFGQITGIGPIAPRVMQGALKLEF